MKTWKTRPNEWMVPVKHGLREYFYIGSFSGVYGESRPERWLLADPAVESGLPKNAPLYAIRDRLIEAGKPELAALLSEAS